MIRACADRSKLKKMTHDSFIAFVSRFVNSDHTVLDIGCDDGSFAEGFCAQVKPARLICVDLVDSRKTCTDLEFYGCNVAVDSLPFADASIDVVVISQVVEHVQNISHVFTEIHRVLKDDGVVIVKLPNYANLAHRIQFLLRGFPFRLGGTIMNGGHINFVPFLFMQQFLSPLFDLIDKKGDFCMSHFISRWYSRLKKVRTKLIVPKVSHWLFSWNIMLSFKKK